MKPQSRKKLLRLLEKLGDQFPEWRLGQLVENVAGWADKSTWDVGDDELAIAVEEFLKQQAAKSRPLAKPGKRI